MKKAIELFLLDLQATGYNIRWVQGTIRYKLREGEIKGVIMMYDTQTDEDLGEIVISRTEADEVERDNNIGDIIREVKYPLLDPETLKRHLEGCMKAAPGIYSKYLQPEEEELSYDEQAEKIAKELGLTLNVKPVGYGYHFIGDKEKRHIFRCELIRAETEEENERSYSFRFGQSIASGAEEPTMYDVLACLQKYNPGDTLQEFCDEFGYDPEDEITEGIYELVLEEWEAMEAMFSEEELERLHEIS